MELTRSYLNVFPEDVLSRYSWIEVRNAAAMIQASDPQTLDDLVKVLSNFNLTVPYLLDKGGGKSKLAADIDTAFRELGWRETHMSITTTTVLARQPWRKAKEKTVESQSITVEGDTHKVDNVQRRVAIDVEWHAKDGNLDRDVSAFRALFDAGVIDVGVIITRSYADIHYLANWLAHDLGRVNYKATTGAEVERFGTTTSTTMEKLEPRMRRGDGGGCPILAIGLGLATYTPDATYVDPDGAERTAPEVPAIPESLARELTSQALAETDDEDEDEIPTDEG
ncbi:MAG: BglII/BstYI family type II restriction endonuclease [Actinomycetales bacterium]